MIDVAVGVIINSSQEVLMTQRALSLHQGGLWEFPGGKVEKNESVEEALIREFQEELNIRIQETTFLMMLEHHYAEKSVKLHVYKILQYNGIPKICDGQLDLQWFSLRTWNNEHTPVPVSNIKIMAELQKIL